MTGNIKNIQIEWVLNFGFSPDSGTSNTVECFIFGGCILLRSLLGLYYSGRQSQQSFDLLKGNN
jgi:hypothetical protein